MLSNFEKLREEMIENQIIKRGIKDAEVIEAFRKVPREDFLPPEKREFAYFDGPVELSLGQTISQPFIVALMVYSLKARKGLKCLEIGTGSGYLTAILLELGLEVYSIERHKELANLALKNLKKFDYKNYKIFVGDGTLGLPEYAPFDRIIVSACAPKIPASLIDQLTENEGIMIIPIGENFSQKLIKITKNKNILGEEFLDYVRFVPLIGKEGFKNALQ